MERLCAVVRASFRRQWRTIACQIHAVNCDECPKSGFLFDCGSPDATALLELVEKLKSKKLIDGDVIVAKVKEDVFILKAGKFVQKRNPIVIDVSGSLEKPAIVDPTPVSGMMLDINNQIKNCDPGQVADLKITEHWCIPTVFGYLINYPILYHHQPDDDANCLGLVDLKVYQVTASNETLVSFSVPAEIHDQSEIIRESVSSWLNHFRHQDYQMKTFIANYPTVIL